MNVGRALLIGTATISFALASTAVQAKGKPASARKLALSGMQASADNCVVRTSEDGKWRLDEAGKWVKCRPAGGGAGGGSPTALYIAGGVAAAGIAVAVATASSDAPSSP